METKQIRKELKEKLGYNARQVSVRNSHYTCIVFTVRDSSVNVEAVKKFSKQFEDVSYDEYTQCILRGGNTFVNVRLSEAVEKELKAIWLPALEEAAAHIKGNVLEKIPGSDFMLGKDQYRHNSYNLWNEHSHITNTYGLDSMALELAQMAHKIEQEPEESEQSEEVIQELAPEALEEIKDEDETEELNAYELRQQEKRERYAELAKKAEARSDSHYEEARRIGSHIPFGQPILIGHHSEGRARRDAASINRNMGKCVADSNKAEYYRNKAEGVGNGGISSDDPAAVKKLKEELATREKKQKFMKTINRVWRAEGKPAADHLEAWARMAEHPDVKAFAFTNMEGLRSVCAKSWRVNAAPFASYELTNNNSSIKRINDRIKSLQLKKATPAAEDLTGEIDGNVYTLHENSDLNRIQILFNGKPPEEIRADLKRHGFRWSPRNKAWQRQLNQAGKNAAERMLKAS